MEKIRLRACALVVQNGAVLLIEYKNDPEDDEGIHYNLPAGSVEPGETFVEAVIREAWEEINQDIIDYCNGKEYRNYVEEHEIQQAKLIL